MSDTQSTTPVRSRANRGKTPRKRRHPSPPQKPSAGNVLVLTPEPITPPHKNIQWPKIDKMGELIGFVGRENEAYEAAEILVENARIGHIASNQSSSKPSLVILPQMNGSGKTTFARKFRDVLTVSKVKNWDELKNGSLHRNDQIIDDLRSAELVLVNLEMVHSGEESLKKALYKVLLLAMKRALTDQQSSDNISFLEKNPDVDNVTFLLTSWDMVAKKPILIVWDDLQHLEGVEFTNDKSWPSVGNPIPRQSGEKQQYYENVETGTQQALRTRLDRMYCFWDAINPSLTLRNVFTLVCGKSPTLAFITQGYSSLNSPSYCKRILMNPLRNEEIKASLITTVLTDNGDTLYDFLIERMGLSIATIDYLCEQIRSLTGGVARFVEQCFLGLYNCGLGQKQTVLSDPNTIDIFLFDKKNLDKWFTSGDIHVYNDKSLSEGMRIAYIKLYLISSFNVPFSLTDELPIKGLEKPININGLLTTLGLWTEAAEHNSIRLVFPRVVMLCQNLNEKDILKHRFPLLAPLQSSGIYLDPGEILENLVLNILYFIIAERMSMSRHSQTWGELFGSVFKGSFVADLQVRLNLAHPISFLPHIMNRTGDLSPDKIQELITMPWSSSVPYNSWKEILKNLFRDDTFGKPYKKSHSQDLSYRASRRNIVAFAIKNWGASNPFTWKDLQEEIDKSFYTIKYSKNKKLTLLVLARTIGDQLKNWTKLTGGIGMLQQGSYKYKKSKLQQTTDSPTILVPQDMEVIVLGKKSFNHFIGDENVKVLESLADKNTTMKKHIDTLYKWLQIDEEEAVPLYTGDRMIRVHTNVLYTGGGASGVQSGSGTSGVPSESVEAHAQLQTIKISNGKVIRDIQVESSKTLEELRKSVGPKAIKDLEPSQVLTYVDMKITDPNIRVSSLKEGSIIYFEQVGEEW